LGFARSSVLYRSRRIEQPKLVERLKALAAERPRFGYRRLHLMLGREGFVVNHKRVHRLYRVEGLALRRKRRKRLTSAPRLVRVAPTRPNERWSMDFVSDATVNGRRFRVLNVVDEFTREALVTVVATSISGARVARELDMLASIRGKPETIVSDNGPEFISKAMDAWAYSAGVKLHFIRPGKPIENAYVESFNGHFRDECL
jgi:putative transposase